MSQKQTIFFLPILGLSISISLFGVGNVYATDYSLSITTSGAKNINLAPSTDGSIGTNIATDDITVTTSCHSGYNFTLSTSVNNNNLYLNGDANNNTAGTYFAPSNGSTALSSAANTWGYYYSADSIAPTKDSVFNAIPALGSTAATIKTPLTTPSSTDITDSFAIYYGVAMDNDMPLGTYKMIPDTNNSNADGSIAYQATIADSCISYSVHFSPTSIFEGQTISGTGTMADQVIYEGVATNLSTNTLTAPSGYYFAGWNTAQDGSGTTYTNGQQVTDLTSVGGSITLYAMWTDCQGGYICYNRNDTTTGTLEGTMGRQSVSSSATSATLFASNYSNTDYGFAGWSPDKYATSHPTTAIIYGPNENITFTAGQYTSVGLKLYAVWVPSAGSFQNTSESTAVCNSLTAATYSNQGDADEATWSINANLSSISALTDNRDNQTYAIAKLSDNNCWMIENLRLDDSANLTIANTNNPLNDGTNVTLKLNYNDTTTTSHLSPTSSVAYDESTAPEGWCTTDTAACDDQSRLRTDNTANRASYTPTSGMSVTASLYSYGNYYNWYSATAGNGKFSTGSGVTTTGDLCPTGWHLPTGTGSGEFGLLSNSLGGYKNASDVAQYMSRSTTPTAAIMGKRLRHFPNNFLGSGTAYGGSLNRRGSYGYYWSSTAHNAYFAYNLYFESTDVVDPGSGTSTKFSGRAIRCLAGS